MIKDNKTQLNPGDEVQLIDSLLVLWKRKWLIIVGTLVCVVTAGIVAFNMPKVYEVSSSIEVRQIEDKFVEEAPVISQKIKSASLKEKITQELSIPLEGISGEDFFKISFQTGKDSLVLTTKIGTDKPNQGIKILEIVNQTILKDHQQKIEEAKEELSEKITLNQNRIRETEAQIESLKKELSDKITINERRTEIQEEKRKILEKQLLDIQKEIVALQQIRDRISKGGIEKVDVVGMVAYFNDFQARLNSLYWTQSQIVDQIPSQIQSYRENIATLQARLVSLDGLPLKIRSYEEEIATLEGKLVKVRETKVIDPPHSSYYPVKPQKKIILAVVGVTGFFFFIFLASFLDYLGRYRRSKV